MDSWHVSTEEKQSAVEHINREGGKVRGMGIEFSNIQERQQDELVERCIRHMLCRNVRKIPVKHAELIKFMFRSMDNVGRKKLIFVGALERAQQRLRNTFGMEIAEINKLINNPRRTTQSQKMTTESQAGGVSSIKGYILVSVLPQEARPENGDWLPVMGFIMVVASMILMQPGCRLEEQDLYTALKRVGVHVREVSGHKQLHGGDVKKLLEEVLVEQWYFGRTLENDTNMYTLGPRLRTELSDNDLIEFVNMVYKQSSDSQEPLDDNVREELMIRLKEALRTPAA